MLKEPKLNKAILIQDGCFVISLAIVPIGLLMATILLSGSQEAAINALKGDYKLFGLPTNPWRQFLPDFSLMIGAFIISIMGGFTMVRIYSPKLSFHRFRLTAGILFVFIGSIFAFMSLLLASNSHLMFQDVLFGSPLISPVLILFLSLVIFVLGTYKLIRICREVD